MENRWLSDIERDNRLRRQATWIMHKALQIFTSEERSFLIYFLSRMVFLRRGKCADKWITNFLTTRNMSGEISWIFNESTNIGNFSPGNIVIEVRKV